MHALVWAKALKFTGIKCAARYAVKTLSFQMKQLLNTCFENFKRISRLHKICSNTHHT